MRRRVILDILTEAVHAELAGNGWRTVFDTMTEGELLRFDGFLLAMGDQLAWQHGPVSKRFQARVERMARAKVSEDATDR